MRFWVAIAKRELLDLEMVEEGEEEDCEFPPPSNNAFYDFSLSLSSPFSPSNVLVLLIMLVSV